MYLDGNAFTRLPSCTVDLPHLERLRASHNRLRRLPAQPFLSRHVRLAFENNPKLNYVPFNLGCRQSSLNASAAAIRAVIDAAGRQHLEEEKFVWTFNLHGCRATDNKSSESECLNVGIRLRWIDGREETLWLPPQMETACAFIPKKNVFVGVRVAPLLEQATRVVFRLAFQHTDTASSKFMVNGVAVSSVRFTIANITAELLQSMFLLMIRERTGEGRRPTKFGRSLCSARHRIPMQLLRTLQEGPMALCAEDNCAKAIFHHATIIVLTPSTDAPMSPN